MTTRTSPASPSQKRKLAWLAALLGLALLAASCSSQEDLEAFCEGTLEVLLLAVGGGEATPSAEAEVALKNPPAKYRFLLEESWEGSPAEMASFLEMLASDCPQPEFQTLWQTGQELLAEEEAAAEAEREAEIERGREQLEEMERQREAASATRENV